MIAVTKLRRARVTERLERATRYPVTLIVAPAGFGKTVALRDFLETARVDAVRYDVARDDRTLVAFAHGLSAALAPVAPTAIAAFPAMQQRLMASDNAVRDLADWFSEHLKRTVCTIVIDDLHFAAADPQVVPLLVAIVERAGERLRWILAARSDVGLPVASWVGYGRMDLPIGEADLRFTLDEALAVAEESDLRGAPDEIDALRELTGGWPVALSIALRTRTHASDLREAASGTREMVYRYLAEQVFAALDRTQQTFLLRTSVFVSFDAATAEALGATPEFLDELRRRVTFLSTTPAGDLRYHDLFRDFLEHELRRAGASPWFAAHVDAGALLEARPGGEAAALRLYAKVGAVDAIVRAIEHEGVALLERGEGETLIAAIDAIPESRRGENPAVLGVRAMLDANRGRFDAAERSFVAAIDLASDRDLRIVLVHRYAIELVRANRECVALLEPYARDETLPLHQRTPMLGTLATAYVREGRLSDGLVTIRRALDLAEPLGDEIRARIYQQAAYVYQFEASSERARRYAADAVELAAARGLYEVAARAYTVLATIVAAEDDDPIATLAVLDKLGECARKGASRQTRFFGIVTAYGVEIDRGDDVALERLDAELAAAGAPPELMHGEVLLPAHAARAAWEGDFRRAFTILDGTAAHQATCERRALRAAETSLYAFAAGLHAEGEDALREATGALEECTQRTARVVRSWIVLALAELMQGHTSAAHRYATEAERAMAPAMRRLRGLAHAVRALERVQLEQADPAAVTAALERLRSEHFGGMARLLAALPLARGEEPGYARLTPSERAILQLLARGASTKDVAAKTGRSPQTVDTHIRSICRKLNCSGRREAIAIATGAGWVTV